MDSTRQRMVMVAVLVCLFAVGMAGLLNFFKYRSTAERIVKERLVVIADTIETSIQQSLGLGLQFSELNMLASTLERERANDDLILGIEVFDMDGQPLYTTDKKAAPRTMPASWRGAAHRAGGEDWFVDDGADSAAGIVIENNFGLKIGYLGVRYDSQHLHAAEASMALQLAGVAAGVFVLAATLASLALLAVMRRLSRQISALEGALRHGEAARMPEEVRRGPFGRAMGRFFETVHAAETQIAQLRSQATRGGTR
jgi:hypothetical protein